MKYMRGYENGFGLIQKPKHAFLTDSLGRSSFLLQIMAGGQLVLQHFGVQGYIEPSVD